MDIEKEITDLWKISNSLNYSSEETLKSIKTLNAYMEAILKDYSVRLSGITGIDAQLIAGEVENKVADLLKHNDSSSSMSN